MPPSTRSRRFYCQSPRYRGCPMGGRGSSAGFSWLLTCRSGSRCRRQGDRWRGGRCYISPGGRRRLEASQRSTGVLAQFGFELSEEWPYLRYGGYWRCGPRNAREKPRYLPVRATELMSSLSSVNAMNFCPSPIVYFPFETPSKTSRSSSEMDRLGKYISMPRIPTLLGRGGTSNAADTDIAAKSVVGEEKGKRGGSGDCIRCLVGQTIGGSLGQGGIG